MNKNLTYDFEIIKMFRQVVETAKQTYPEFSQDTRYMDHFNDTCPKCKRKIRISGRRVSRVDAVSCYPSTEDNRLLVYCICKTCSRELDKQSTTHSIFNELETADGEFDEKTLEYVVQTLSGLKEDAE